MQISHLQHDSRGIHCSDCGREFEVRGRALTDPARLLEWKEGIAAKHVCRPRTAPRPVVRVWTHPTGADLPRYYQRAMRRLLPA
jgi:hypothetical protein